MQVTGERDREKPSQDQECGSFSHRNRAAFEGTSGSHRERSNPGSPVAVVDRGEICPRNHNRARSVGVENG